MRGEVDLFLDFGARAGAAIGDLGLDAQVGNVGVVNDWFTCEPRQEVEHFRRCGTVNQSEKKSRQSVTSSCFVSFPVNTKDCEESLSKRLTFVDAVT